MRLSLHNGVWAASIGVIGGGLALAFPTARSIGAVLIAVGLMLFAWGLRIDGRPWWRSHTPRDRLIPYISLRELAPLNDIPITRYGAGQNNAYYVEQGLQQAAVDRQLIVKGRPYRGSVRHNDPVIPIPPEHFVDYGFAHGVLGYDVENDASHTSEIGMAVFGQVGKKGITFYDIYFSRADLRKVLPLIAKDRRIVRD